MKVLFYAILMLALPLMALAQNPIITVTDTGPTQDLVCPPSFGNCTSANFTVPSTGDYYLDSWTRCPGTDCENCFSCAVIYKPTGQAIEGKCTAGCPNAGCTHTCTVHLEARTTYTLSVCLMTCPVGVSPCDRSCTANACVDYLTRAATCY